MTRRKIWQLDCIQTLSVGIFVPEDEKGGNLLLFVIVRIEKHTTPTFLFISLSKQLSGIYMGYTGGFLRDRYLT